jgi:hypothetical protein
MSPPVRQKYWHLVHSGAWERSKKNFQWLSPLAFGGVVFLLTVLVTGFDKARDGLIPRLFVGAGTVLFAIVGYGYNLFRSASDIYVEQLNAISRIEQLKESAVHAANTHRKAERAEQDAFIRDLLRQLNGKQKDQALADKLTKLHRYGISDLLNRQPPGNPNRDHIDEWRHREDQWRQEVLATMYEHGCTQQDLHKVDMIGSFTFIPMHPITKVSKDLSMLKVRLDRIQEIIDKYAE